MPTAQRSIDLCLRMSTLLISDPSRLSLPALPEGAVVRPTGFRDVRSLPASLPAVGPGFLLFGTHDIRGRGGHVEPSPHCDPFILCSAFKLPPGMKPPFCARELRSLVCDFCRRGDSRRPAPCGADPHCGTSVASILLQGISPTLQLLQPATWQVPDMFQLHATCTDASFL